MRKLVKIDTQEQLLEWLKAHFKPYEGQKDCFKHRDYVFGVEKNGIVMARRYMQVKTITRYAFPVIIEESEGRRKSEGTYFFTNMDSDDITSIPKEEFE